MLSAQDLVREEHYSQSYGIYVEHSIQDTRLTETLTKSPHSEGMTFAYVEAISSRGQLELRVLQRWLRNLKNGG